MGNIFRKGREQYAGWLMFFYSIPSKPVSNRMKIWRKLLKAGTVQLKGAVYVLPMNEEHYEFFQWLVSEVSSMGGEAAYTWVKAIDSIKDEDIKDLFNKRQEGEYQSINRSLDDIETMADSQRKGSKTRDGKALSEQLARVRKNYAEALKTDFFFSKAGTALQSRIDALNAVIKGLVNVPAKMKPVVVFARNIEDYQGKKWITRKRPFVDRMASTWLIKRFIDRGAVFDFIDERDIDAVSTNSIVFDMRGGEFTHVGDLCTFEVLVKSFAFKGKTLRKMAEIVHDLDTKDDKYKSAEAKGLEDILIGIRKTAKDDRDALEKGMAVFEMLYMSKS